MSRPVLLTERQIEVLAALALLRSPVRVAARLGITPGSASASISDLRRRLHVATVDEIVPRARELGILR